MFKLFKRKSERPKKSGGATEVRSEPSKATPKEMIVDRANSLRADLGLGRTTDAMEIGSLVLTVTAMEVLQKEGALVHPESMDLKEATAGFAFICYMATPVISALDNNEIIDDPNRFLMMIATSVFQFFDKDSTVAIFMLGTDIFRKSVDAGGESDAFKDFTDQVHKLVLVHAFSENEMAIEGLSNRYKAYTKLISK